MGINHHAHGAPSDRSTPNEKTSTIMATTSNMVDPGTGRPGVGGAGGTWPP